MYPLVIVEWRDAHNDPDWKHVHAVLGKKNHTYLIRSVGFLIKKSNKEIILAHGICDDGETESTLAIPRDWCQKIKYIKPQPWKYSIKPK